LHGRRTARRRQVIGEFDSLDDPELAAPFEADPCELLLVAEQAELVRAVLLELPDEYALLLSAKYFDDVSVEQLAAESRSSEVAVRSKLARARRAFRIVLESHVAEFSEA
jgi:RNA polymerase sigma-70 factor (ECF subfamily)